MRGGESVCQQTAPSLGSRGASTTLSLIVVHVQVVVLDKALSSPCMREPSWQRAKTPATTAATGSLSRVSASWRAQEGLIFFLILYSKALYFIHV